MPKRAGLKRGEGPETASLIQIAQTRDSWLTSLQENNTGRT